MRYDVFLSFRGEEIGKTFLSHLLHSLDKKGIRSVASGASNPSENQAASESRVAISLIWKNYTSLDLWVEELAKIIAGKGEAVVPIFLRVDPEDVLRFLMRAENSVAAGNEPRQNSLETVKNWLGRHVTSKYGFKSSDWEDDSDLVDQITYFISDTVTLDSISERQIPRIDSLRQPWLEDSLGRTATFSCGIMSFWHSKWLPSASSEKALRSPILQGSKPPKTDITSSSSKDKVSRMTRPSGEASELIGSVVEHRRPSETIESWTHEVSWVDLPGMKSQAEEMFLVLRADSTNEVDTVGIYGMEGVGKTSLAKYLYQEISPQFQQHFFINNFSKRGSSLLEILASETLKPTSTRFFSGSSTEVMKEIIGRKILVVADSVDDIKQLKGFAREISLFGPGSRVIVITLDRSLLIQCGVKHIYQVRCPGYEDAIQLFSKFAFMQTNPVSGFESLSRRAVEVAGRIPLALKVLGSFLYPKNKGEWESTLCKLEASHNNYAAAEVLKYIGADDFAPTSPTILELEENEANRFPLYSFTFQ